MAYLHVISIIIMADLEELNAFTEQKKDHGDKLWINDHSSAPIRIGKGCSKEIKTKKRNPSRALRHMHATHIALELDLLDMVTLRLCLIQIPIKTWMVITVFLDFYWKKSSLICPNSARALYPRRKNCILMDL